MEGLRKPTGGASAGNRQFKGRPPLPGAAHAHHHALRRAASEQLCSSQSPLWSSCGVCQAALPSGYWEPCQPGIGRLVKHDLRQQTADPSSGGGGETLFHPARVS